MSNIKIHIEKFKLALKKEGLKFTEQRFQLVKFLYKNDGHYECEDLIRKINKKNQKLSRATVYRTLDILVKYGRTVEETRKIGL